MPIITCDQCTTPDDLAGAEIQSRHQTSEGIVVYAKCANGHTVVHLATPAYAFPPPPQSVLDLRNSGDASSPSATSASQD